MTPKAGAYHKNIGNKAYRDKYDDIFRKSEKWAGEQVPFVDPSEPVVDPNTIKFRKFTTPDDHNIQNIYDGLTPEIYSPEELKRLKATTMPVEEFERLSTRIIENTCRDTAGLFCQCNTCKEIRKDDSHTRSC